VKFSYEDLKAWCVRIVEGPGGLEDWHKYECFGTEPTTVEVVEWVIRCLGNPKCEGSSQVLEAIADRREFKQRGGK